MAEDDQGLLFLASSEQFQKEIVDEAKPVTLIKACEWYISCDAFAEGGYGSVVPLLERMVEQLKTALINGCNKTRA